MSTIYRIPIVSYDERIALLKELRSQLGPMGSAWSFATNRSTLEVTVRNPDGCAALTFLTLKYGNQLTTRK